MELLKRLMEQKKKVLKMGPIQMPLLPRRRKRRRRRITTPTLMPSQFRLTLQLLPLGICSLMGNSQRLVFEYLQNVCIQQTATKIRYG